MVDTVKASFAQLNEFVAAPAWQRTADQPVPTSAQADAAGDSSQEHDGASSPAIVEPVRELGGGQPGALILAYRPGPGARGAGEPSVLAREYWHRCASGLAGPSLLTTNWDLMERVVSKLLGVLQGRTGFASQVLRHREAGLLRSWLCKTATVDCTHHCVDRRCRFWSRRTRPSRCRSTAHWRQAAPSPSPRDHSALTSRSFLRAYCISPCHAPLRVPVNARGRCGKGLASGTSVLQSLQQPGTVFWVPDPMAAAHGFRECHVERRASSWPFAGGWGRSWGAERRSLEAGPALEPCSLPRPRPPPPKRACHVPCRSL